MISARAHYPTTVASYSDGAEAEAVLSNETTPVMVVDLSHLGKGKGLVATRDLNKGETVFIEHAPVGAAIAMPRREVSTSPDGVCPYSCCQNCFSSLEPASTFFDMNDRSSLLKLSLLWPNPEYKSDLQAIIDGPHSTTAEEDVSGRPRCQQYLHDDGSDRILCRTCKSMFCSSDCKDTFLTQVLNDCCHYRKLLDALLQVIELYENKDVTNEDDYDGGAWLADYWAVVLATRIFCTFLTHDRRQSTLIPGNNKSETNGKTTPLGKTIESMCGDESEMTLLKVGFMDRTNPNHRSKSNMERQYTVDPFYEAICNTLSLNEREKTMLPLELFQRLVIVCRRNSLDVKTTSLFACYQENLIQEYGAHQDEHKQDIKEILRLIGNSAIAATGGRVDVDPNEYGAIHCCALLPLFSNINHSCDPNLDIVRSSSSEQSRRLSLPQWQKQPYVVLVATRDIAKGEELTICYLSEHGAALEEPQRNQRLESRYLFTCHCSRCSLEQQQKEQSEQSHHD